mmetsp:Transcript_7403/g.6635  ORF Transcript_7403/g.6635 Transcript_7403/m.6635 type:complete len:393 (-) Transcript_7403:30-1208(-)
MVCAFVDEHPLINKISLSPTVISSTISAEPNAFSGTDSSPSSSAKVINNLPPVNLAILFNFFLSTLLTAIHPAVTKYLIAASSIPFVVNITFAPAFNNLSILSLITSYSLALIFSTSSGLSIIICTPNFNAIFLISKSTIAIFAFLILRGICCEHLYSCKQYPFINSTSRIPLPVTFNISTAFTGYLFFLLLFNVSTANIASTAIFAYKSQSFPIILLLIDVFAALINASLPNFDVLIVIFSAMNLIASFLALRNPEMIEVGCICCSTNSLARFNNSEAIITTEVVPSPTSLSCKLANSTNTFAHGCSKSNRLRIVAPSFVITTSPISSTNILSKPNGPNDDFTILDTAIHAVIFCVRTSLPDTRVPAIGNAIRLIKDYKFSNKYSDEDRQD